MMVSMSMLIAMSFRWLCHPRVLQILLSRWPLPLRLQAAELLAAEVLAAALRAAVVQLLRRRRQGRRQERERRGALLPLPHRVRAQGPVPEADVQVLRRS